MSTLFSSQGDTVKLVLESRIYAGSDRVFGMVEIDYQKATGDGIEAVRVKLRGVASTRIRRNNGQSSYTYRSTIPLVREDITLWNKGTYPTADSHIMSFPFEFRLPNDIPGSFHASSRNRSATISYGVEVVADRPGLFKFNRRVGQILMVLPLASREDASHVPQLLDGWMSNVWTTVDRSAMIRKRFWGDYSEVKGQLNLPALRSFPVSVPIPISIVVTTTTKVMPKADTPPDAFTPNSAKPLFPAPPAAASQITFRLRVQVAIKARRAHSTIEENIGSLGGFGPSNVGTGSTQPLITQEEPQWIPENEKSPDEKGQWKRQVRFDAVMKLTCSPTFSLPIMSCQYELRLEVPFPGLGNNLEWRIPLQVNSGMAEFNPEAPPPAMLDVPPAYFSGEHHDWDANEKSGLDD